MIFRHRCPGIELDGDCGSDLRRDGTLLKCDTCRIGFHVSQDPQDRIIDIIVVYIRPDTSRFIASSHDPG